MGFSMKIIIFLISSIFSYSVLATPVAHISGVVTISDELLNKLRPSGVLFVFAKAAVFGQPPIAVIRIPRPHFPQTFSLSARDVMIKNSKFEGSMQIMARYSPNGNPMKSSDSFEGIDSLHPVVNVGTENMKIKLMENFSSRNREIKIPMH
jgi:hypothetical protein